MKRKLLTLLACVFMAGSCVTDLIERFQPDRCGIFFDDGIVIEDNC